MSFWKCTGIPRNDTTSFTIGKIYELNEEKDAVKSNNGIFFHGCFKSNAIEFLMKVGYDFEEVKNMFNKDSLKTGMLVETKNGTIWVVLKDSIYGDILLRLTSSEIFELQAVRLEEITEDLQHKFNDIYTIVKAVKPLFPSYVLDPKKGIYNSIILYHREEPKKLTVSQIEEILGYKIKVVAEKEN